LGKIYISTANSTILACFRSSIGYDGYSGTTQNCYRLLNTVNNPFTTYGYNYDLYFSTAKLNITSMSNFIVSTSKVQIDFNIFFSFPTKASSNNSYTNVNRLVPISSFLQYIPHQDDPPSFLSLTNGSFTEYVNAYYDPNDGTNLTNNCLYNKRISFLYSGDDIIKTYTNFITLNHRVLFAEYLPNPNIALLLQSYPSLTNSIFVTIYN
jgi:hypothetical protein